MVRFKSAMPLKTLARAARLRAPAPEVVIVGAGAVGLMLANLLGKRGIKTLVVERERDVPPGARAIGVTPPSLAILKSAGLESQVLRLGVKVRHAEIYGTRRLLGRVDLTRLDGPYPFILTLPEETLSRLLANNLRHFPCVRLRRAWEATGVRTSAEGVRVKVRNLASGRDEVVACRYLCACDGKHSTVRRTVEIPFPGGRYRQTFLMGAFRDETGLKEKASLYFTARGLIESYPLPGNYRRWIVETPAFQDHPDPGLLVREVARATGHRLRGLRKDSLSPFGIQHYLAGSFYLHRVVLCGDAAHIMSPIGGLGMNVGFGDADLCAHIFAGVLKQGRPPEELWRLYAERRRRLAAASIRWTSWFTRLASRPVAASSGLRNLLVALGLRLMTRAIPAYFAMLRTPGLAPENPSSLLEEVDLHETEEQDHGR